MMLKLLDTTWQRLAVLVDQNVAGCEQCISDLWVLRCEKSAFAPQSRRDLQKKVDIEKQRFINRLLQ